MRKEKSSVHVTEEVWTIYSKKKNAIWQKPYKSLKEAEQEFNSQMSMLDEPRKKLADWKIEQGTVSYWVEKGEEQSIRMFNDF